MSTQGTLKCYYFILAVLLVVYKKSPQPKVYMPNNLLYLFKVYTRHFIPFLSQLSLSMSTQNAFEHIFNDYLLLHTLHIIYILLIRTFNSLKHNSVCFSYFRNPCRSLISSTPFIYTKISDFYLQTSRKLICKRKLYTSLHSKRA